MVVSVMTVGGSDVPMVNSIKELKPDLIFFICSSGKSSSRIMVEGEGLVCGIPPSKPNILVQTDFPQEKTTIIEVDPDDPYAAYFAAKEIIGEYKGHNIYADYTGGTKSMSAGLFLAATEFDYCRPVLVKGPRSDLIKVTGNRSRVSPINRNQALISRYKEAFKELLNKQDYRGARQLIQSISVLGGDDEDFLNLANVTMNAFDLWDRFQYEAAWQELDFICSNYKPNQVIIEYKIVAGHLVKMLNWLKNDDEDETDRKQKKESPYPVYDLMMNAERKARAMMYDDAVARLYRATELYAQFALWRLGIRTSNITEATLNKLPDKLRDLLVSKRREDGKLMTGLRDSYELLYGLEDPIGQIWRRHERRIMDIIQIRNFSNLAHGFQPVDRKDYELFYNALKEFIYECDEADPLYRRNKINLNNFPDLPTNLDFLD